MLGLYSLQLSARKIGHTIETATDSLKIPVRFLNFGRVTTHMFYFQGYAAS